MKPEEFEVSGCTLSVTLVMMSTTHSEASRCCYRHRRSILKSTHYTARILYMYYKNESDDTYLELSRELMLAVMQEAHNI